MNCPSRTDEPEGMGMNQSPPSLSAELTTRADLNGMANSRALRRSEEGEPYLVVDSNDDEPGRGNSGVVVTEGVGEDGDGPSKSGGGGVVNRLMRARDVVKKFGKFMGPGMMIAVAYIDPGNYSTDVAAGASYQFKLLFIVLMSNIFAIFLQSLCIKLGSVSGLNLAEACKEFLPKWLNICLYIMAEAAIIATDIAEVIGTAIAINLLIPQIPLVVGCALSICDVLLILLFYNPNGSMKGLRIFEMFVAALVLGVVVCFCIQLAMIEDTSVGEVFKGYLPSSAIIQSQGLYQACGILGATVMPHSLYLGSGIVQPRLQDYDRKHGIGTSPSTAALRQSTSHISTDKEPYYPSLSAINYCMKMSIIELCICLFTFALFVNSAILITAGSALYTGPNGDVGDADLFGIHNLLSSNIAPVAGTVFALALLLSGISAGIVCTIAGQMVSEGALNWSLRPWLRRLITRSISITPSIIIAGAVGKEGLSAALNGSQVALSVALPFVSAPLIYFTCRNKYMTVKPHEMPDGDELDAENEGVKMRNNWITTTFAVTIWLIMCVMNVANLVLLGKGQ
ncbi:natural resistance-associated macrophage protein-domain-containing protein [Calycina marina]|uniref:Natural resistance-associated macrophage protein-domain-containing protein n=1 Tax=Calycina marina TaxID=1763456 RepID=A0A9P7Z0W6_9HELO|nr:natural resistance-associated macrophage protein-domain-containing protein [Calycina marina]